MKQIEIWKNLGLTDSQIAELVQQDVNAAGHDPASEQRREIWQRLGLTPEQIAQLEAEGSGGQATPAAPNVAANALAKGAAPAVAPNSARPRIALNVLGLPTEP
jgi:hypothetical protein